MDFTREPIIETVITPKEGWTLVIRNSKSVGQEEYFVDAVEVVTFGSATFYRTQERPKAFLLPISDYEVVEVRETRMVLKNITLDRSIKIGSGKEFPTRGNREAPAEKPERAPSNVAPIEEEEAVPATANKEEPQGEATRLDRKRDRKRNFRRKRSREEVPFREEGSPSAETDGSEVRDEENVPALTSAISNLLPPPPTLISETIARYKDNALFKGAFFSKEEATAEREKKSQLSTAEERESVEELEEIDTEQLDILEELDLPELPQMSLDFPVYGHGIQESTEQPENSAEETAEEIATPVDAPKEVPAEQLEMSFGEHMTTFFMPETLDSDKPSLKPTAISHENENHKESEEKDFL